MMLPAVVLWYPTMRLHHIQKYLLAITSRFMQSSVENNTQETWWYHPWYFSRVLMIANKPAKWLAQANKFFLAEADGCCDGYQLWSLPSYLDIWQAIANCISTACREIRVDVSKLESSELFKQVNIDAIKTAGNCLK